MPDKKLSVGDIQYSSISRISYERLAQKYSDKNKLDVIFKFMDGFTPADTGHIQNLDVHGLLGWYGLNDPSILGDNMNDDADQLIQDKDIQNFINYYADDLKGITVKDFKEFLLNLIQTDKEIAEENKIAREKFVEKNYANIPENIKKNLDKDDEIIKTSEGYVLISHGKGFEGQVEYYTSEGKLFALQSDGAYSSEDGDFHYLGEAVSVDYWHKDGTMNDEGLFGEYATKLKYKESNIVDYRNYDEATAYREVGKTRFNYDVDNNETKNLRNVELNQGLPNALNLNLTKDENGNIIDIGVQPTNLSNKNNLKDTPFHNFNSPINMNNEEKNKLMKLINSGKKFGEDFNVVVENNQVKVQAMVINNSQEEVPPIPEILNKEFFALQEKGLKPLVDFKVKYTADGNFEIDLLTKKAIEDDVDQRKIEISKDGKTRITTSYKGENVEVKTEQNGGIISNTLINRNDAFIESLLLNDFTKAKEILGEISGPTENFDFYAACRKYQEIKGKSVFDEFVTLEKAGVIDRKMLEMLIPDYDWDVMELQIQIKAITEEDGIQDARKVFDYKMKLFEAIKNYDLQNSPIADMLPQINRKIISENEFEEIVDGKIYNVKIGGNEISVTKDKKTFVIDLTNVDEYNKNILKDFNAKILYTIASQDVKLNWQDFSTIKNVMPDGTEIEVAREERTAGFYTPSDNSVTIFTQKFSAENIRNTVAHEMGHAVYIHKQDKNEELERAFLSERDNWQNADEQFKEGQHTYCLTSINEMFAECYSLAVTGKSDGAYTIAKYFPKTFAIVKQIIEQKEK